MSTSLNAWNAGPCIRPNCKEPRHITSQLCQKHYKEFWTPEDDPMSSTPPQDALDLYAFGVQWCEERGIPIGHIRVRWHCSMTGQPTSATGNSIAIPVTWVWDDLYQDGRGAFWYPVACPPAAQGLSPVMGLYLSFPSAGDAECYGLSGVQPFRTDKPDSDETCLVWVQPGHEFGALDFDAEFRVKVRCRKCDIRTTFHYPDTPEMRKAVDAQFNAPGSLVPPPPGIQLPACVRRHRLSDVFTQHEIAIEGDFYAWKATCFDCRATFREKIAEQDLRGMQAHELRRRYDATPFIREWARRLGRCPGPSEETLAQREISP